MVDSLWLMVICSFVKEAFLLFVRVGFIIDNIRKVYIIGDVCGKKLKLN